MNRVHQRLRWQTTDRQTTYGIAMTEGERNVVTTFYWFLNGECYVNGLSHAVREWTWQPTTHVVLLLHNNRTAWTSPSITDYTYQYAIIVSPCRRTQKASGASPPAVNKRIIVADRFILHTGKHNVRIVNRQRANPRGRLKQQQRLIAGPHWPDMRRLPSTNVSPSSVRPVVISGKLTKTDP